MMWTMLQSHKAMAEFSKHEIKYHLSITSIFSHFFVTANISDPLQDIAQMKRDIKGLSAKSDRHHSRLNKLKY